MTADAGGGRDKPFGPYGGGWGGDNSVPQGTLIPLYVNDLDAYECPWSNWDVCDGRTIDCWGNPYVMPDLRGWVPEGFAAEPPECWLMCLNGQTVMRGPQP